MQVAETTKRQYRTKSQKIQLLKELKSGGMTISNLARKHDVHPVTIHKWKREMSQEAKKESVDLHEILQELEKIKEENNHLKKAVGNLAMDNEILKTANDILKKSQRLEKLKSPKK
jgi:transposase-like protein